MIPEVSLNYVAILIATIVSFAIGALWYGPIFGKQWMALSKLTKKDLDQAKKKGMAKSMIAMFVATLVMEFVLAKFLKYAQATSIVDGITVAFCIWIGFIATVMLSGVLWENRPVKLYLINASHYLAALVVSAFILISMA